MSAIIDEQKRVCEARNVEYCIILPADKVVVSGDVSEEGAVLNGMRHLPRGDTTGWYIWANAFPSEENVFEPIHAAHLLEDCPQIVKVLGLPPGHRFLIHGEYEDIWFDAALLVE